MAAFKRLIPLADRVLIRRIEPMTKTAGGILLPDAAQKKEREAEVVAIGPGALDKNGNIISMNVKVGDKVLLPEYGGQSVKLEEEEFQLFRESDLLGRFE